MHKPPLLVAALLIGLCWWALAPGTDAEPAGALSTCVLDQLHPMSVQTELLDPVVPGRWIRVRLTVVSAQDLGRVVVDLAPMPGVEVRGETGLKLGGLGAGESAERTIEVRVPDQRDPLQVFVRASGQVGRGLLSRGASIHLLPQGRHQTTRVSPVASDGSPVLEHTNAARRKR